MKIQELKVHVRKERIATKKKRTLKDKAEYPELNKLVKKKRRTQQGGKERN